MSVEIYETQCCGLHELANISDYRNMPEACIQDFCDRIRSNDEAAMRGAFIFFTGVVKERYGQQLASYIRTHKLGKVVQTLARKNLRSGNSIKTWVWAHDRTALRAWAAKRDIYI